MDIRKFSENGTTYVKMPLEHFELIMDWVDAQEAETTMKRIRSGEEEAWPSWVVDRLLAGDNPTKVIREWRGLTQKSLANQTAISLSMIARIERNSCDPRIGNLRKLADALRVDLDDLIGWERN